MATYRAKCWLGSANGYQELEVQSNTVYGATEQFKSIYGAEQVINCRRVNDNSSVDISGDSASIVGLVFMFAIIFFWKYVLLFGIVGLICWYLWTHWD